MLKSISRLFKKNNMKYFVTAILLVAAVGPIIWAASYGVFSADDFTMMSFVLKADGNSGFIKALANTRYYYNEWSGSYAVYFIEAFMAYMLSKHNRLLALYLVGTIILFVILFGMLVKLVCDYAGLQKKISFWFFTGTIIPFFCYRFYTEIYYWFIGNCGYCLSLIIGLIELNFLLAARKYKSKICIFMSLIFAAIMGGMWLEVLGAVCYIMFMFSIYDYIKNRRVGRDILSVFAVTVAGGIVAVCAPGNYVRHSVIDTSGTHPFLCLFHSFITAIEELMTYVENPYLILFMIILFYIGVRTLIIKTDTLKMFLVIANSILLCMVTCYPVLLGYSTQLVESMPNRCMFVFDFIACICLMVMAFEAGTYFRTKELIDSSWHIKSVICCVWLLVFMLLAPHLLYTANWVTLSQLSDGEIRQYSIDIKKMLGSIKNSDDQDMLVYYVPKCPSSFREAGISEDEKAFANVVIAEYYHKHSVRYIPSK